MIATETIERIIAGLVVGERAATQDAIAVLRTLQIKEPVPGLNVPEYADELSRLSHDALAMTAACAVMQYRLTLERLAHVRAEYEMIRDLNRETPTLAPPSGDTGNTPTLPSPAPPPSETGNEDGR